MHSLMFLGLLLDITDLLCHALKRILVVGILELELCIKITLDNSSRTINDHIVKTGKQTDPVVSSR